MKKRKRSRESKIKKILYELLKDGFFNEGRSVLEMVKKLDQRGFVIKGKK